MYDVDPLHPAPIKNEKGQNKTWPEVAETGIYLPAKESVAPMKTYIQNMCHKYNKCGEAGKWESTVKEVDSSLTKQQQKVKKAK